VVGDSTARTNELFATSNSAATAKRSPTPRVLTVSGRHNSFQLSTVKLKHFCAVALAVQMLQRFSISKVEVDRTIISYVEMCEVLELIKPDGLGERQNQIVQAKVDALHVFQLGNHLARNGVD